MRYSRYEWLVVACLMTAGLFFSGCKDDTPSKGGETSCTINDDCNDGVCIGGTCQADGDATDADTEDGDTSDTDDGRDSTTDTGDSVDDSETIDQCLATSGRPFECACDTNNECASGRCFATIGGNVCSKICNGDADCGSGPEYQCIVPTDSGGDQINLCVPLLSELCRPCDSGAQCSNQSVCFEFFDASNCLIPCDDQSDCPESYTCDSDSAPGGEQVCVPDLFTCSSCFDPDFDDAGEGPGCAAADCDQNNSAIFDGAVDICDNLDNDCDDVVDQDFIDENGLYTVDDENCGLCGFSCNDQTNNPNVAEGFCDDGACGVTTCKAGFLDCSAEVGCEATTSDPRNCGSCGNDCIALSNTGATNYTCGEVDGGGFDCVISACDIGFADCNDDSLCEADLSGDNTCGTCVTDCDALPNTADGMCNVTGSGASINYGCGVDVCEDGFCDHDLSAPGCEDPQTNARFCGPTDCSVSVNCTDTNVIQNVSGAYCDVGTCNYDSCSSNFADCNVDRADGCEADIRFAETCTSGCFDCNALVSDPAANVARLADAQCNPNTGCLVICDLTYANCDGEFENGCEASFDAATSCGSCDNDCTERYANSVGSCGATGVAVDATGCALGACESGFVDADGKVSNGCECELISETDLAGDNIDQDCDGIDGTVLTSIFVATANNGGNDFNAGTMERPVQTITKALELAGACAAAPCDILVSAGVYGESLTLLDGLALVGGYNPLTWERDVENNSTVIRGQSSRTIVVQSLTSATYMNGFRIEGFSIPSDSSNPANNSGQSTSTVWIKDAADHFALRSVEIVAGAGQTGAPGTAGTPGAAATSDGAGGSGGSRSGGGASPCGSTGGEGQGTSTCSHGAAASVGTVATGEGTSVGSRGSAGGHECSVGDNSGGTGGVGGRGGDAAFGNGGSPAATTLGSIDASGSFVGTSGTVGTRGKHGAGGGGAGAGGSDNDKVFGIGPSIRGGSGGGGGAGGCGGSPAASGGQGGASVAVVVSNSTVECSACIVTMGLGGSGGRGGTGGPGGVGTSGGAGEVGAKDGVFATKGGDGGRGGDGGGGGGGGGGAGGAGGPSIGFALANGSTLNDTEVTYRGGQGGTGGQGGPAGFIGGQSDLGPAAPEGIVGTKANIQTY